MTQEHRRLVMPDREIHVQPHQHVRTAWVPIDDCVLASKYRRSIGDVERKMQKLCQMGSSQPWPPVTGHWSGDRFHVMDGGHTLIAALTLGLDKLLVAWLADGES